MDMQHPPERPQRPPPRPSPPLRAALAVGQWMDRHRTFVATVGFGYVVGLQALSVFDWARHGVYLPFYIAWVALQAVVDVFLFFPLVAWMNTGTLGLAFRVKLMPRSNDGIEQDAFEAWARAQGYKMALHPLHWLFLDDVTYAARQGWKAGIEHCRRTTDLDA